MMRTLSFGVELQDKRRIEHAAEAAEMSVSEWCRTHLRAVLAEKYNRPDCRGPGWYTITRSAVDKAQGGGTPQALRLTLQPDGYIAELDFVFVGFPGLRPDIYSHSVFAQLLQELGHPYINDTNELHGQRMYLPRLWVGGKPAQQIVFTSRDVDYILNGACSECALPHWAQNELPWPLVRP